MKNRKDTTMKRIGMIGITLIALAGVSLGDMDDKLYNLTVVGSQTNSSSGIILRGTLEAVVIDVTAPSTSTVTVATSDGRTLFSKADIAADAVYHPLAASHTTVGGLATFSTYSVTGDVAAAHTQTWYVKQPMAGAVTVTLVGQNGTSVTNNTKVTLIYSR
jgi:hypothetical protein